MWQRYVAIGDSITAGYGDPVPGLPLRSWTDWLADELAANNPPFYYRNFGQPGANIDDVQFEQLPQALASQPDLVSLTVGANDVIQPGWSAVDFERRLSRVLRPFHEQGSTLLTYCYPDGWSARASSTQPVPQEWQSNLLRLQEINQVIRQVSQSYNACLLDFESFPPAMDPAHLSFDRVHPNAMGYKLLAEAVVAHLNQQFEL